MNKTVMPPMGWNSYDYYDTTVNEEQIKANADYMAAHLKQFGWEYIVVDIEWYAYGAGSKREQYQYIPFGKVAMDEFSRLLPCEERFPSAAGGKGFAPLAEYVHSLGLKFGIHIMRGIPRIAAHLHTAIKGSLVTADMIADPNSICQWNPDMYGVIPDAEGGQAYYDSLMALYAEWKVDFVKCDDICRMDAASSKAEIHMLHEAIEKCGRDILLSLSPGPAIVEEADFYHENANMWRITDDFWDSWDSLRDMFERCHHWQEHVKDGGYPDCDMLPVGWLGKGFGEERRTNFTKEEQKTMLTLWCLCRSPLMIGAELTKLDEWTLSLLTNQNILSLLEDSSQAQEVYRDTDKIIWQAKSRLRNEKYMAVFNITESQISTKINEFSEGYDLWENTKYEHIERVVLPAHGCKIYRY